MVTLDDLEWRNVLRRALYLRKLSFLLNVNKNITLKIQKKNFIAITFLT